jgi:putative membrane protein
MGQYLNEFLPCQIPNFEKTRSVSFDVFRGLLMGVAEVLPGISGGTVALIIGIYERVVFSASQAVKGFLLLLSFSKTNWKKARERFRGIDWKLLIPLLVGMVIAILGSSAAVYPLIIAYPTITSAAFAGLILGVTSCSYKAFRRKLAGQALPYCSCCCGFCNHADFDPKIN